MAADENRANTRQEDISNLICDTCYSHELRTSIIMAILLTQSQVSVAFSTAIVLFFTILLFLSGYSLQKQSTTSLREAVRPRIPSPPPTPDFDQVFISEQIRPSRLFGGSASSKSNIAYQKYLRPEDKADATVDWRRLAHVQLVKSHHEVCNAIMVFGELHRLKSPARRVLLFPREWALEKEIKGKRSDSNDPYLDSSKRLLRLAVRRYGVELHPVEAVKQRKAASVDETSLENMYSLASAFSLTDFDRIMVLETPGLVLDASPLDAALAFTDPAPFAMLHDTVRNDGVHSEDLFLLQPDTSIYESMISSFTGTQSASTADLASMFESPLLLASSSAENALVRSVGVLHDVDANFNQTAYLQNAAYVRFWDPKLPGPEYEVPYSMKRQARPANKDADWIWTKLYGTFAQKRSGLCGLDLEHWSSD